ncbi:MAG: hypothetical protein RBU23_12650 [Candidatus Auribacterota bacterium]|jgi:hypothetical protein|nr:hypothetical protein [Candidatus Auribacterota bacterium]
MALPAFIAPYVPPDIQSLETSPAGLVSTVRAFLEGNYDPTSSMFKSYLQAMRRSRQSAGTDLRDRILSAQGAQRIYGGAAGKQLNQALLSKVQDDLDREQEFLWQTLDTVIGNRQFGLSGGQNLLDSARQYAVQQAQMQNDYNMRAYQTGVAERNFRRSNTLTARNLLSSVVPAQINEGTRLLSRIFFPSN